MAQHKLRAMRSMISRFFLLGGLLMMLLSPALLQADPSHVPRLFNVRSGETVAKYAQWTGLSKSRLRRMLGLERGEKLRAGMGVRLDLTHAQWRRLQKRRGRATPSRTRAEPARELRPAPDAEQVQIGVGQSTELRLPATTHKILPGEYGWRIAFKYGISLNRLREANGGPDFRGFRSGRVLVIPERSAKPARRYVVKRPLVIRGKRGETLALLSQWSGVPVARIMSMNQIRDAAQNIVGKLLKIPIDEAEWESFQAKR